MDLRPFGPRQEDDEPGSRPPCVACYEPFKKGDYTVLVPIGPSNDPEQQARAAAGRPYTAVAVEAHYSCVTGRSYEGNQ